MKLIFYMISFFCLVSCSLAPKYQRPPLSFPSTYKETGKWQRANPTYAVTDRGPWWKIYNDTTLNNLEVRVTNKHVL
jgi:outer membrane protein TolC